MIIFPGKVLFKKCEKKKTHLALAAIVRSLILAAAVEAHFYPLTLNKFQYQATLSYRPQQTVLD